MLKNFNTFEFECKAKKIKLDHGSQNIEIVNNLNAKYKLPVFGEINPINLIQKLAFCIDPSDRELYGVNQLIHMFQTIESMERNHEKNEEYIVGAILHDIGKILLLTDEDPANIVCDNKFIIGTKGAGWKNCISTWNHDEFGYMRLKEHLPKDIAWLIRYHSINLKSSIEFADNDDKKLIEKYLIPFSKHDKKTKSMYHMPKMNLDKCARLLEKHLPSKLVI